MRRLESARIDTRDGTSKTESIEVNLLLIHLYAGSSPEVSEAHPQVCSTQAPRRVSEVGILEKGSEDARFDYDRSKRFQTTSRKIISIQRLETISADTKLLQIAQNFERTRNLRHTIIVQPQLLSTISTSQSP